MARFSLRVAVKDDRGISASTHSEYDGSIIRRLHANATADDSATADSARPLDPLASLEDPRATCREQGSILGKRTRDSLNENQKDVLEQHSSKRTQNEYERRPRRKTREDRYEYKPSGSREKPKLPMDKKRRARPGRKQTMNDGFHASNVARERLTVRTPLWSF